MEAPTEEITNEIFQQSLQQLFDTIGRNTVRELNIYEKIYHYLLIGTQQQKIKKE